MNRLLRDPNLHMIFGVSLMMVLGVSSVMPVFPRLINEFEVSVATAGLIITLFTLPGVFLTPVGGVLADRIGRKAVLVPSLFLFGISGALCAFAPDFETLLVLRFIQGMGAAPLGALSGTLLGDFYSGPDLATATGYNASILSVGTAAYPAIGGFLGLLGWNYPFLLPLLAIPLGIAAIYRLDSPPLEERQKFLDYLKTALTRMNNRTMFGLFACAFATFILLYGPLITFYPILLDTRFGASPLAIGLIVSVASLFTGLASSQLGRLSRRMPEKQLLRFGYASYAASFLLTPFMPNFWTLLLPLMFFGLGQGLTIPSVMTILNRMADRRFRAGYMAVYGSVLRIAQASAPLLLAGVHHLFGLDAVFYTGTALALVMVPVAWFLVHPDRDKLPEG